MMMSKMSAFIVVFFLLIVNTKGENNGNPLLQFFFGDGDDDSDKPLTTDSTQQHACPDAMTNATTVYVHWGRSDCIPDTSDIVYSGYLGGGHYTKLGAGTNPLCLPDTPEYDSSLQTSGAVGASVYGAEFETGSYAPFASVNNGDVVCAVCLAHGRSTTLMIPAKITCPLGWTKEYGGLLMGSHYSHNGGHEYFCVDANPGVRPQSTANSDGFLLYAAGGICGSLPCPPYIANNELSCVVCTK